MTTMTSTKHRVRAPRRSQRHAPSRGFTLIELLVVMGIIAILGVLTTVTFRGIATDARLASGKNTVAAVLDNARGLAMKNNRIVAVAFVPKASGKDQWIECVTAQWTGESAVMQVNFGSGPSPQVVDRFAPVPDVPRRAMPKGIKIAGPFYGSGGNVDDFVWITQSHLPRVDQTNPGALTNEMPGDVLAVMYAPNGTTVTRNSQTDSARMFLDLDSDGVHEWGGGVVNYSAIMPSGQFNQYFEQFREDDECWMDISPFLTVFDDDQVRRLYDQNRWAPSGAGNDPVAAKNNRRADYSEYLNNNADRIHFNRYTGVVMK